MNHDTNRRQFLQQSTETERFTDCDEANQLLSKKYRQPLGLPDVA